MRALPVLAAAAVALLALTGCARAVSLPVADEASDPGCAQIIVTLPEQVGDAGDPLERRSVTAQGTAAWGDPSAITLRCGMPLPAPSTNPCTEVGGVDWLEVGRDGDAWTFISYGRSPATEMVIDTTAVTAITALEAVSSAVDRTERVGTCS